MGVATVRGAAPFVAALALAAGFSRGSANQEPRADRKPVSFSNRLLLNRAAIAGLRSVEVMLAVDSGRIESTSQAVEALGGRVRRVDAAVGYLRVDAPLDRVVALGEAAGVSAYQVASLSRGSWYRDGPPQSNAEMYRGFERPAVEPRSPRASSSGRPLLSPAQARQAGYTADDDAGVGAWLERHPAYDGRGVTIALLESGQPDFAAPIFEPAITIEGGRVSKVAGILNTIASDQPDETRVDLREEVEAHSTWTRVGDRTYAMPHPSRYRLGVFTLPVGPNLFHQFAVLEEEATSALWVDANANGDFRDEASVADVNERFDPRTLKITHPRAVDVPFVVAHGRDPHTIHLYLGRASHQTMTVSVAAGNATPGGLAYGVAPGARVLLVRNQTPDVRLRDFVEGYLEAARRPDVDVLCDSAGIAMVPDTAADFVGLMLTRIVNVYGKPIFHSAGNMSLWLGSVSALGDTFAVGGSIGPRTFEALYGGAALPALAVHPVGAAGPAIDGALKPDFLAPVHRVAVDTAGGARVALPKNAPAFDLPPGYQISCCTSASSPYAAGVAALLLSAAKLNHLRYSWATLSRALRVGATLLPDVPVHQQGNGVMNVEAAWNELRRGVEVPHITTTARVVHPLARYAVDGLIGHGLFERDGWFDGDTGTREMRFLRTSGPARAVDYRVSWSGNDGTFASPGTIRLPLDQATVLPVVVTTSSSGAHSAILNLHDPDNDAIVFRTQATVVAAERFDRSSGRIRLTGSLPLLASRAHYVLVERDAAALSVELSVLRGTVRATVLPAHGLYANYYGHRYPQGGRTFTPGTYRLLMPNAAAGTWTLTVENTSGWREPNLALVSTGTAEYAMTVTTMDAKVRVQAAGSGALGVDVDALRAPLGAPALDMAAGTLRTHRSHTSADALPNQFEIEVPPGAGELTLTLRLASEATDNGLELHLYDCTSGECFSFDFTLPDAPTRTISARHPRPGRWIAAVSAAPKSSSPLAFELDEIVTSGSPQRVELTAPATPSHWSGTVLLPHAPPPQRGSIAVAVIELIDTAAERDEAEHPWETRALLPRFADRPVVVGSAIYPLR